jgi:multidrug efflux system membrane fusion protein
LRPPRYNWHRSSNARASLAIERQALKIAEGDLKRQQRLLAKNSVSHSEYEKDQRNLLAQKQRAQTYLNSINLYPVERKRLHAELAKLDTQLSIAKLNLERATVTMPFNGRIAEVNVEYQQFVGQGKLMVVADGIDRAEVSVQIPMGRLFNLVYTDAVFNTADADNTEMGKLLGISARVLLRQNNLLIDWDARVARISGALDPRTRTVGVIIEVDKPYERVQPGKRPPLMKGLFVDVELYGRPHVNSIVIPLSALHDQEVYVVNAENRLERRNITTGISGSDYVVVKDGLKSGEQIVLSYLAPAIDGMLLKAVDDTQALNQLLSSVSGSIKP